MAIADAKALVVAATGNHEGKVYLSLWLGSEDSREVVTVLTPAEAVAIATKLLRAADGAPDSYYVSKDRPLSIADGGAER